MTAHERALRCRLLAELPDEIGTWIARTRFRGLTYGDIASMWKHDDVARRVVADNIRLLPIWLLLAFERRSAAVIPRSQPVAFMKTFLHGLGVPPRAWRLLCRLGHRVFPDVLSDAPTVIDRFDDVCWYLRLLGFGELETFSKQQKRAAWWFASSVQQDLWRYGCNMPLAALRRIRTELAHWRVAELHSLDYFGHFHDMEETVSVLAEPEALDAFLCLDARPGGKHWKSWGRLADRLREHVTKDRSARQVDPGYPVRVGAYSVGLHDVVPLGSVDEVADEGIRMRNCLVHGYVARYGGELAWLHSIRNSQTGASVATVAIESGTDGVPFVARALGFANGEVPAHVTPIVMDLLARHCAAARSARTTQLLQEENSEAGPELRTGIPKIDAEYGGLVAGEVAVLAGRRAEVAAIAHSCIDHVITSARRSVVYFAAEDAVDDEIAYRHGLFPAVANSGFEHAKCIMLDAAAPLPCAKKREILDDIGLHFQTALVVIDATADIVADLRDGSLKSLAAFFGLPLLVLLARDGGPGPSCGCDATSMGLIRNDADRFILLGSDGGPVT